MLKFKFFLFTTLAVGLLSYQLLRAGFKTYVRQMESLLTENLTYHSKESLTQIPEKDKQSLTMLALESELLKIHQDEASHQLQFAFPVLQENQVVGIIHGEKNIGFGEWFTHYGMMLLSYILTLGIIFAAFIVFIYQRWIVKPLQMTNDRMVEDFAAKLQAQINRSDAIFKSMIDGVLAVDANLTVIDYNQNMASMLRIAEESSYKGSRLNDLVRIPSLEEAVKQSLASREHVEVELRVENEENKAFFLVNVSPLDFELSNSGQHGALIVFHDITHVRRLEKIRTDFVSNVSHELKTPLTSMRGIIEMFENKSIPTQDDQDKFLGILSRQGQRLESIINDLLMLARIEEDETKKIDLVRTRLKDVVDLAAQACSLRAKAKKIEIVISLDAELTVMLHPTLFEQALVNLITNAIDYSPEGTFVTVGALPVLSPDGTCKEIEIFVKDQGPGIETKYHDQIWHRFYRMDKSRNRQSGGSGLGLAIVKHIAMVHGGRVGLVSQPGQGSLFKIFVRS